MDVKSLKMSDKRKLFRKCLTFIEEDSNCSINKISEGLKIDKRTAKKFRELALQVCRREIGTNKCLGKLSVPAAPYIKAFYERYDYFEEMVAQGLDPAAVSQLALQDRRGGTEIEPITHFANPEEAIDKIYKALYYEYKRHKKRRIITEKDQLSLLKRFLRHPSQSSFAKFFEEINPSNKNPDDLCNEYHLKKTWEGDEEEYLDNFYYLIDNRELILKMCDGIYVKNEINTGGFIKNNNEIFELAFDYYSELKPKKLKQEILKVCFNLVAGKEAVKLFSEINGETLRWYMYQHKNKVIHGS